MASKTHDLITDYENELAQINSLIAARNDFVQKFLSQDKNPLDSGWTPGESARKASDALLEINVLRQKKSMIEKFVEQLQQL